MEKIHVDVDMCAADVAVEAGNLCKRNYQTTAQALKGNERV